MAKKTSCGGLKIDNETIVETNGVLKASALPAVTSADAGRVLMVDASGKWVVASLN